MNDVLGEITWAGTICWVEGACHALGGITLGGGASHVLGVTWAGVYCVGWDQVPCVGVGERKRWVGWGRESSKKLVSPSKAANQGWKIFRVDLKAAMKARQPGLSFRRTRSESKIELKNLQAFCERRV